MLRLIGRLMIRRASNILILSEFFLCETVKRLNALEHLITFLELGWALDLKRDPLKMTIIRVEIATELTPNQLIGSH